MSKIVGADGHPVPQEVVSPPTPPEAPASPESPTSPKRSNDSFRERVEKEREETEQERLEREQAEKEAAERVKIIAIQYDPVTGMMQSRPVKNVTAGFEMISIMREAINQIEKQDLLLRIVRQAGPALAKQLRAELEKLTSGR